MLLTAEPRAYSSKERDIDPTSHLPDRYDVVVVGAGAAGIFAAWRAADLGCRVLLLEKTNRIGTKILISGGGKCNVAHDGSIESVLAAFRKNEQVFIRPSCYRLKNTQIIEMMTSKGLRVYTRPDGRVFPVDQTAKDVVRILRQYLEEAAVEIRLETPVTKILTDERSVVGVETSRGRIDASNVVVAVGGASYPNSGTTGDGWPWARALGHTIVPIRAALAPMYLEFVNEADVARSGVSLRDCVLKARSRREIARWRGDLLFTHRGVSGPTVLGISRVVAEATEPVHLEVDLAPDRSFETLTGEFLDYARLNVRKLVSTYVGSFLPERLVPDLLGDAGIRDDISVGKLERKSRNRLIEMLKSWPIGKVRAVPLEKGEVTAGGISLDELNPQTMESKLVSSLYFCGEILDIAGPVGGYNLQAAFATGFVAGESAAQAIRQSLRTGARASL